MFSSVTVCVCLCVREREEGTPHGTCVKVKEQCSEVGSLLLPSMGTGKQTRIVGFVWQTSPTESFADSSPSFLKQGLSLDLKLTSLAGLAGQRARVSLLYLPP